MDQVLDWSELSRLNKYLIRVSFRERSFRLTLRLHILFKLSRKNGDLRSDLTLEYFIFRLILPPRLHVSFTSSWVLHSQRWNFIREQTAKDHHKIFTYRKFLQCSALLMKFYSKASVMIFGNRTRDFIKTSFIENSD